MIRKIISLTLLLVVMCLVLSSCDLASNPIVQKIAEKVPFVENWLSDHAPATTTAPSADEPAAPAEPSFTDASYPYNDKKSYSITVQNLPDGASVYYCFVEADGDDGDEFSKVKAKGHYKVRAYIYLSDGTELDPLEATLSIKEPIDVSKITFSKKAAYAGSKAVTPEITGLPEKTYVSYIFKGADGVAVDTVTEIGTYTVEATIKVAEKYAADYIVDGEYERNFTFEIVPDSYVAPTLSAKEAEYNGKLHSYPLADVPAFVKVDYEYKLNGETVTEMKDAGTYEVVATFSLVDPDNAAYTLSGTLEQTTTFTVRPKPINLLGVSFSAGNATYTGSGYTHAKAFGVDTKLIDVTYTYSINGVIVEAMVNAGEYTVTATFTSKDPNYVVAEADATKETTFTINKRKYSFDPEYKQEKEYAYTGEAQKHEFLLNIPDLPGGVTVDYIYIQNGRGVTPLLHGEYQVTAVITATNFVFEPMAFSDTFTIVPAAPALSDVVVKPSYEYTGGAIIPVLDNLPAGVSTKFTYSQDGNPISEIVNVGTYTVTVEYYSLDGGWTGAFESVTVDITVLPKKISVTDFVTFPEREVIFDDSAKTHEALLLDPSLMSIIYTYYDDTAASVSPVNAGSYAVKATVTLRSANYIFVIIEVKDGETVTRLATEATVSSTLTIKPADRAPQGVQFDEDGCVYDGEAHEYFPTGYDTDKFAVTCKYFLLDEAGNEILGDNDQPIALTAMTDAGLYRVVATFTSKDPNYAVPADQATYTTTYLIFKLA